MGYRPAPWPTKVEAPSDVDRTSTQLVAPLILATVESFGTNIGETKTESRPSSTCFATPSSLIVSPTSHATRLGKHTADLTVRPKGPVTAFEKMISHAVDEFGDRLGVDSDHPFIAHRPKKWHLAIWAIVLEGEGYQIPHIHRSAWLSGVYYAQVPDIVREKGQAGWIEFGEPGPEYSWSATPQTSRVQPEPGLMVLFPSYVFHKTIPFESDQTRVSVAFDVVPDA